MTVLFHNFGEVWAGFRLTVLMSLVCGLGSLVIGTLLAAMRVSPLPVLRAVGTLYVNTLRNTPLTLVILFCSLGISVNLNLNFSDDININNFWLGALGLTVYTAAFVCESLRAGINTVPFGQAEAARSIGLTFPQSLRLIVLPQAFRAVIAPLGSVFIALIKNTTVTSFAGVLEASVKMKELLELNANAVIPIFFGFALGFVVLTLPTGLFFGWLAKRLAVAR